MKYVARWIMLHRSVRAARWNKHGTRCTAGYCDYCMRRGTWRVDGFNGQSCVWHFAALAQDAEVWVNKCLT